ncbi:unnamed protein product [Brassicogethes aeneus]|uniref:RRM domain-containing protein n=1 Tax=Brassicogethes aeneus TaxID=1431903 RepID=A0A9P0FJ56_BRAAE|nr:unnamed protein product [Brassicogethes aeneus]
MVNLATLQASINPFCQIRSACYLPEINKEMGDKRSYPHSSTDEPPNSRLFVIGSKMLKEEDFRSAFGVFGTIEEIWVVKDRSTGENKGVTYIKFAKTSEAACALEAMNGKSIGNVNRSIKVMIAASRDQGSKRESNEEEKTLRLFVVVPKTMTDSELYDEFKTYGDIDYANILKDKETRESKGFAYVKYYKFSHAAIAFEECDKKYRPVFAEPRKSQRDLEMDRHYSAPRGHDQDNYSQNMPIAPPLGIPDFHSSGEGFTKLIVIASPVLNQDQLWKLFDIVPGLDYCHVNYEGRPRPTRAVAEVAYTSPQSAAHAREKLHGFEYPMGFRLIVRPEQDNRPNVFAGRSLDKPKPDILQIAETIAQASSLIQAAGFSPDILQAKLGLGNKSNPGTSMDLDIQCSVKLPERKPLAKIDDETVARCFIVCFPSALHNSVLKDVFSRFENLIDVYMLNNKNCGYANYSTKKSAEEAIKVLHGAEIMGIRMKVMEAQEKPDHQRKRQRIDSPF